MIYNWSIANDLSLNIGPDKSTIVRLCTRASQAHEIEELAISESDEYTYLGYRLSKRINGT